MEKYQSEQVQSDVTISGVLELQAEQLPSCIFSKYKSGDSSPTLPFRLWNQDEEMNQSFGDASNSEKQMTRGPYKKYTEEEKLAAVEQVNFSLIKINKGYDVKYVSKKYDIPRRNLLRWRKNGCIRKEGGGRPTDT